MLVTQLSKDDMEMMLGEFECNGDWLTVGEQLPGGIMLDMRSDPTPSPIIGYLWAWIPSHGPEQVSGVPVGQIPPSSWKLNHFWYGDYWLRMVKVGRGPNGSVVPMTCAEVYFTVGPEEVRQQYKTMDGAIRTLILNNIVLEDNDSHITSAMAERMNNDPILCIHMSVVSVPSPVCGGAK